MSDEIAAEPVIAEGVGAPVVAPVSRPRVWPQLLGFLGIVVMWYTLSLVLPLGAWLMAMLAWVEGLGLWGPLVFMVLYVPSCVLMFPDVLPNAAAGAVWGVWVGAVAVSFGRVLGSMATFLIMRRLGRARLEARMAADPRFIAIADAVGRQGFRVVVLLRLCPMFPAIMLNYGLGLTRVSLPAFMAGTLLGMIPRTLFVAYAGAGTHSVAALVQGDTAAPGQTAYFVVSLLMSLMVIVILAHKARRLLDEATRAGR